MDDTVFIRTCDGAVFDVPSVRYDTPNTEIELSNDLLIMQFTGLTDINGVEIYEGDIVRLWYAPRATAIGFISFENGGFVFNTEKATPKKEFAGTCIDCGNSFTVIGNIYQNPELLK
jgi:uncharacterized phage protein (TIGR01671 family)